MDQGEVMVLGASGLVGSQVVRALTTAGRRVVAVSRVDRTADHPLVRWVRADVSQPAGVEALPECHEAVSTLPVWVTADVAPGLAGHALGRLVAFSSTSALTKTDASDEAERALAARLLDGERRLLALPRPRPTILRPTIIYGGRGDHNVERIAELVRRFGVFPLVGNGSGRRQPVHAADLADAAVRCLDTPRTEGKVYTVAGGEVVTVREMVTRVAGANGRRARFVRVPRRPTEAVLRGVSRLPGVREVPPGALERLGRDLVFDNGPATQDFGYAPRAFAPPDYRAT